MISPNCVMSLFEQTEIPKVKSPHKEYPCASDAIDVQYSRNFGRHIVAKRDIEIGELLVVENPYFRYPDTGDDRYMQCSHCATFMGLGIPCEHCVNCVYCTEKCKNEAWNNYHMMDCLLHDLMIQYESPMNGGQCARLLSQLILEAGGLDNLKDRLEQFRECKGILFFFFNIKVFVFAYFCSDYVSLTFSDFVEWPLNGEWYKKSSLELIFTLMTHADKVSARVLREAALSALRIVFIIATYTDFFGTQYKRSQMYDTDIVLDMSKNPDVLFIGGLLMRIFLVVRTNHRVMILFFLRL